MAVDLKNPQGCRAAIVGTGVSGQSAARLLEKLGASVTFFDEKTQGPVEDNALCDFDFIVLSPGFPRRKLCIANALAKGVLIINEIDLAAEHLPACRFIGVTGTNGKSTTTAMIGDILRLHDPSAFVGGNLGTPLCDAVLNDQKPSLGVIELSSFQLETISRLNLEVAVVTHLTPDHLDRYNSEEDYYAAKNRIFSILKEAGTAVINQKDARSARFLHPQKSHYVATFNDKLPFALLGLIGSHNFENAGAALCATTALGLNPKLIEKALSEFKGLPHRLEFLGEHKGVRWFNDSKATNVESAVIAIKSFEGGVHLIVGGLGKGTSYAPLVEAAMNRAVQIYTIGSDAPKIVEAFSAHFALTDAGDLTKAVEAAAQNAKPGEVILLAPACASYDQYSSYIARGEDLRRLFHEHQRRRS